MAEADDAMRARLGAALPADLQPVGVRFRWPEAFGEDEPLTGYGSFVVDALLPTVRAIVADELQELRQRIERLADDFDANGNSRPLGDPAANAWHKAGCLLRDALDPR